MEICGSRRVYTKTLFSPEILRSHLQEMSSRLLRSTRVVSVLSVCGKYSILMDRTRVSHCYRIAPK
ncbi:hypothetical protein AR158_c032L [Paramecium bursaria Chlorella virus AR158]|uniref:hypothetical protein n=1 Tax=Paramecium bursaria Chlorella virus AR158 TaxID=380598 RepID=UPI00015AA742|nr:hypothetical protein AR158_c032L [Paramecium bursaria Chlorella virus AR158]ABU43578.1 hypothetical protein AR158_c032L [Paramecium bursaria Chlorella virus AR158]